MQIASDRSSFATASTVHRIRVVDLVKTFRRPKGGGTVTPVNRISLNVSIDEMVVLLGPSGCGKTTLLRCVAGLEQPDSGEIYINDQLVFSSRAGVLVPPHLRPVSMVFQSYALWPHMSVFDNVAYPLRSRKSGTARQIGERVDEVLSVMGLDKLARQYPGQLSGGQQQRVALARAIVPGTGVVLFDEPLSNVDARIREQLREEIRRIQRKLRFSALYVTHDQVEAMAVADQIAVLDNGCIVQKGSAEEIYDRPRSRYVASFVGGANIVPARIASLEDDGLVLDTAAGRFTVHSDALGRSSLRSGQPVDLVLRPETIAMDAVPAAEPEAGRIESRAFLGNHVEYVVAFGEARLRVHTPAAVKFAEGQRVRITVPPQAPRIIALETAP